MGRSCSHPALAWVLAVLQVGFSLAAAVWLLTVPAVFDVYYPLVRPSADASDARALMEWLSTDYRARSLQLAVKGGTLTEKELRHYLDVRRVLRWVPRAALGAAMLAVVLMAVIKPSRELLRAVQWRAFGLWGALLLVCGGIACWDWKLFFAWMHQPFFGDRSWRMPRNSYSLALFPASFWRITAACVLLAPALTLLAGWFPMRRRSSPGAAAQR